MDGHASFKFAKNHIYTLPAHYAAAESNRYRKTLISRLTMAYFCIGTLDLLGQLNTVADNTEKLKWIDWIYAHQIHSTDGNSGFRGSLWLSNGFDPLVNYAIIDG